MPTFASIGFHPALRSRLFVATGQPQTNHQQNNNISTDAHVTATTRPLETPHSLLLNPHSWRLRSDNSDDPDQTTRTTVVAPHEVNSLRREVARSLHDQTKCGKRQRHIREQNQRDDNNDHTKRRISFNGFLSVSEILSWQSTHTRQQPTLCTGMATVDALLSDTPDSNASLFLGVETHSNNKDNESSNNTTGGISWGTVLQVSGAPGVGKTQFALQLVTDAVNNNVKVHYFVPAFAPPISLARRLAQLLLLMTHGTGGTTAAALSNVVFDTFGDPHELLLTMAQYEDNEWNNSENPPRLIIVDGSTAINLPQPSTWHRLARLYHAIVVVVTPATAACFGSIHLHVGNDGRVDCRKHPQREKVGTVVPLSGKLSFVSDD